MIVQLKKLRSFVLVYSTHHLALPILKWFRKAKPFPYSINELTQMHKGSLGNDLAMFLHNRDLHLLTYYVRHDLKHILLGYETSEQGEVCLQCFMLGNGRISFPVVATVAYGIFTMPEYWKSFAIAFKRGKNSNAIHHWNWHLLLKENTTDLRNKIFNLKK